VGQEWYWQRALGCKDTVGCNLLNDCNAVCCVVCMPELIAVPLNSAGRSTGASTGSAAAAAAGGSSGSQPPGGDADGGGKGGAAAANGSKADGAAKKEGNR
jgi:hypothetical protein